METTFSELTDRLLRFRDERDWGQFHTPKDLAISVSIEASELLELFQWRSTDQKPDADFLQRAEGEVADVLLYLLLLCDRLGIDLAKAAAAKISRNERRFPVANARGVAKPMDKSRGGR